jgi:hypothetical protein
MALSVPLSRSTLRVGGGSAFFVRPLRVDMNFKRPYWLLLFISLGCLVLGYADWMLFAPADTKSTPSWMFIAAYFLTPFGAIGFLSSLLWMIFEGIISGVRRHHPKH